MNNIKLNLLTLPKKIILNNYHEKVRKINELMEQGKSVGSDFLGWKDLPEKFNRNEFKQMLKSAQELQKQKIEVLVVVGIGGSFTGAKATVDFINGNYPSKSKQKIEIIFVGTSLSSTDIMQKLEYVKNKKFAINVISKSGTTLEPALAFRLFKELLENNVTREKAKDLIFVITDSSKGALFKLATNNNYTKFVIPNNIGGRFSVLTPVGLFPVAVIGINIIKMMQGAQKANKLYSSSNITKNEAYLYGATRNFLYLKKYTTEILGTYEPQFYFLTEWWKQLFGESEGKKGKGLFPSSVVFTRDLHSLGQFIQEGKKSFFETIIKLKTPEHNLKVSIDDENLDNLNYLAGKSIHEINNAAMKATILAHVQKAKVPNMIIEIKDNSPETLGALFVFFERACAMSSYLLNINPFNQPGVEVYKSNMFKILGKPNP